MKKSSQLLIAIFALSLFFVGAAYAGPGANPDHVHFSWQNDPSTTITGMWRTDESITASVMEYKLGDVTQSVSGETHSYSGGDGIMHIAEATGLTPKTAYQLRVGDDAGHFSDWKTISTAPVQSNMCEPVRFVIMGDSRSSINSGPSIWWSTMFDAATDEEPDFVLLNGDLIEDGDDQDGWNDWFEKASSDLAAQPIMPVWGNHDNSSDNKMMHQFALPKNSVTDTEDFYSFRYGNALFLALDTEHGQTQYANQGPWMETVAGQNSDAIWKFAFFHRPAYSSGLTHGSEANVQTYFTPTFDTIHVDAAFGSHDHMYERTAIINNGQEAQNPAGGTLYFVTGGAGAFINPINNPFEWFTKKFLGIMHYILVEIDFNVASFHCIGQLGVFYDEYTITKPELALPTAAFSANPAPIHANQTATFDGSASVDPCGTIADYYWEFGDGNNGNGAQVNHVYQTPGLVTVLLRVTDSDGNTNEITMDYDIMESIDDDDDNDDDTIDDDDDTVDDDDDTVDDDDDTADDDDDTVDDDDDTSDDDDDTSDDDDDDDDDGCGCGCGI